MMSIQKKVNQHPESFAAGFEHGIPICGDNHKKVSQNSDGAFDSASLGEAFAARLPLPAKLEPHLGKALRHAVVLRIRSLFSQVVDCSRIVVSS
jgi:hypothetical protein